MQIDALIFSVDRRSNVSVLVDHYEDDWSRGGEVYFPAGATLVDTARWRVRTLDRSSSEAAFAAGVVLASGPRWNPGAESGLRGYTTAGRRVFHLLKGQQVFEVPVVGDWAYARTRRAVRVVDVGRRTVVAKIAPPSDLVDVIHG